MRWNSHFDDWIRDEIVELAAEAGVQPSFPIPDVLATHIVTEETFGIITVPKTLVKHYQMRPLETSEALAIPMTCDTPVHLLTRLST